MHPKYLLEQHGIDPKKSLGQNFLADDNLLAAIADAAELGPADHVLEIGPGTGALTRHLARAAGEVVAVELDDRLLPILEQQLADYHNVRIVHGDILALEPANWFGNAPYKVVANVPYYITGAILEHLLSGAVKPSRMVLTVQKEVAERITAEPPAMSLLAVSVQLYGQPEIVMELKAGAFWPRPEVDSAVVRIDLKRDRLLPLAEEHDFFRLVKAGFSQKRKQIQKNLRSLGYDKRAVSMMLDRADIDGRRRAETLTIGEWLALYQTIRAASA